MIEKFLLVECHPNDLVAALLILVNDVDNEEIVLGVIKDSDRIALSRCDIETFNIHRVSPVAIEAKASTT
jgi:hypothetical protein